MRKYPPHNTAEGAERATIQKSERGSFVWARADGPKWRTGGEKRWDPLQVTVISQPLISTTIIMKHRKPKYAILTGYEGTLKSS